MDPAQIDDEVTSLRELVEDLKERLDNIETKYQAVERAKVVWKFAAGGLCGSRTLEFFLGGAGEIIGVPTHLVQALSHGKRLDGRVLQDQEDRDQVVFWRGGIPEVRMPKSLLLHLSRGKKGEVGLQGSLTLGLEQRPAGMDAEK